MTIAVLADETQKKEFLQHAFPPEVDVIFADSVRSLVAIDADAYFDLKFEFDNERIKNLRQAGPKLMIVNAVLFTCTDLGFVRINAWPTLLGRTIAEVAAPADLREAVTQLFASLNWKIQFVPDIPGMITPRTICMIINEAAYAYGEGVSSREEINLAMKLGTNYPLGPFEWLEKIGVQRVRDLLQHLNKDASRYTIAPYLEKTGAE